MSPKINSMQQKIRKGAVSLKKKTISKLIVMQASVNNTKPIIIPTGTGTSAFPTCINN